MWYCFCRGVYSLSIWSVKWLFFKIIRHIYHEFNTLLVTIIRSKKFLQNIQERFYYICFKLKIFVCLFVLFCCYILFVLFLTAPLKQFKQFLLKCSLKQILDLILVRKLFSKLTFQTFTNLRCQFRGQLNSS